MESEELGSDSSFNANYDGVNGNKNPGDGRGFIQLTGRSNYQKAGRYLGIDLENQPELAAFPSIASKIARWFWQFGTKENLNTFSDGTFYGFSRITSLINGGLNGFKERVELLETAAKTLQCGELMKGRGENCTINGKQGVCKPICNVGMVGKKFCGCNGKTVANQCQGPANIRCCDEKCSNNMDLTFVLDSSGSVGSIDFERAKTFVGQFVDKLEISPNKTQVALVKYATSVDIENYLNSTNSKSPLLTFISRITYTGGSTATGDALNACFDIYSPAKGMRNSSTGVSKVIVVLTDGRSNTGRQPIPVADALKAQKISIISVGVGQNLNLNELNGISSRNRFYRANDYNQVSLIYDELN
ncbi:collagen alpha-1(XXII) chain, partial [Brachionus plicatilis]